VQPRDLAISSWSAARLALEEAGPLEALGTAILDAKAVFDGQDVANIVWAFATLRAANHEEVLRAMCTRALPAMHDFAPRHLVGVAWGLASARVYHTEYFEAAARVAEASRASHWVPQDVANFLWAFAITKCTGVSPMSVVVSHAAKLGWDAFQPQELSISMWSAMTMGVADARPVVHANVQRLLQHAARQVRNAGAKGFEPRHLTNVAWALARWQRHCRLTGLRQECKAAVCRPALRAVAGEASGRLGELNPHELSRFLWALGSEGCLHLRVLAPGLVADLRRPGRLSELDVEELVSVVTVLSWTLERAVWEPKVGQKRHTHPLTSGRRREHRLV